MERWHELTREREFLRAKRDERAELRDAAGLTGEALERKILELFEKTQAQSIRIPASHDTPERVVHKQMSPSEVAWRRRAIRKLVESVEEFNRVDQAVRDVEARLVELERAGIGEGRPISPEISREIVRLGAERAELFRNAFNKARRSMMEDLVERLHEHGLPITVDELGPDPAAVDRVLAENRARAAQLDDPELRERLLRWLDNLGDAAHDVIRVDNA
ncbi:hypothetical protein ACW9HQ_44095, partial [Nocardia gipuzkoensis]